GIASGGVEPYRRDWWASQCGITHQPRHEVLPRWLVPNPARVCRLLSQDHSLLRRLAFLLVACRDSRLVQGRLCYFVCVRRLVRSGGNNSRLCLLSEGLARAGLQGGGPAIFGHSFAPPIW